MARIDSDQKAPWNKKAPNLKAVKTKKEIKERTQSIQGCLTKKPLSAPKPFQKQVEDNTRKQKFRTYFSENVQSKERRTDVSCQVVGFFFLIKLFSIDVKKWCVQV